MFLNKFPISPAKTQSGASSLLRRDNYPKSIVSLFQETARIQSTNPAVQFENERPLSYEALDKLSDRIASRLTEYEGSVIALCLERSTMLIASLLGILKAGAAYVVLDPMGSMERNNFIVTDVRAPIVLTNEKHTNTISNGVEIKKIISENIPGGRKTPRAEKTIRPDSLAYVVYTSGTMGKPKGVLISHGAAARGIDHFSLGGHSRWLLFYNPIFSAAQRTMLATLCHGGCVCLASHNRLTTSLPSVLKEMEIEAVGITPSMLSVLDPRSMPSTLKRITTVGEPVGSRSINAWISRVKEFTVSYGLSECAQLNLSRTLHVGDNPSVVGYPSDTTAARILVPGENKLVPHGQVGELCLAGPQLADGYLGRPAETAERFVPDVHGSGRMYRTGDLARQLDDGSIEILGRVDRQIKINGQRLEPDEVASVLTRLSAISSALVVAATIKGEKALVAAIVPVIHSEWSTIVSDLRRHAIGQLPAYMVPSYWLRYSSLPTGASGKADWNKVRIDAESTDIGELLGHDANEERDVEVITDELELLIRDCWAETLGMPPTSIGRQDTFLSLGGSSMQAIRMINELKRSGVDISLEAIFRHDDIATIRQELGNISSHLSQPETQSLLPFELVDDATLESLSRQNISNAYPATDFQESVLAPTLAGSTHYTYQRTWVVEGADLQRLQLAFYVLFLRNEILRTAFITTERGMMQIVKNDMALPWETTGLSLAEYKKADLEKNFSLGVPLFRVAVVEKTILVVTMHHALFDFWSHHFLYEDVAALYHGLEMHERPRFDLFVSQIHKLDKEQAREFWAKHLNEANQTVLNFLPTKSTSRVVRSLPISLDKIATSYKITSSTLIYGAWALVLSQHTSSSDVTFAVVISGREIPIENIDLLDGPTITVVPRRFNMTKGATLAETLKSAHQESWDILKYSQYGLRKALKAGNCAADVFDTMVNILPAKPDSKYGQQTSNLFKPFGEKPRWQTEFTTLQVEVNTSSVTLEITSSMEETRLNFILGQLGEVLETMGKQPERLVGEAFMAAEEVKFLTKPYTTPGNLPAHMLSGFYNCVNTAPDAIALQWQSVQSYTYAELDTKANRMHNLLRSHGVKPGDKVCLLMEKSPMMIISILGILKAGAAYVPLSPENGVDRNGFIAEDVEAVLTISEADIPQAADPAYSRVIMVEEELLDCFSARKPCREIQSRDTAYLIYTSGSTGKPKGVLISHGAAAAAISSMVKFEGRERGEWRALQFSNYIFDASVLDIFNTLSSGGTLCMAPNERLLSDLVGVINEMKVTHSFFTPTVLRLLNPKDVPTLKSLSVGGEALSAEVLATWAPGHHFVQAYGPTETAMVSNMALMSPNSSPRNLGPALDTVRAFVLDRNGEGLVPYGAVGELCLAGPQLGNGYLKRPDLTAAAFCTLKKPIAGYSKIYRTGDLARWLPGNEVEYLGRKDHQVKVNGHRIELGEIEKAILATGVTDCVTIVAEIESKTSLVSFIVFDSGTATGIQPPEQYIDKVNNLRNNLKGLAHYMYPRFVLPLCVMPLAPSGKAARKDLIGWVKDLDHETLSAYSFETFGIASSTDSDNFEATQGETESMLEKAFVQVLGFDPDKRLGRNANFLALGGDSISAINLTSAVRKYSHSLGVSMVLRYPVLQSLAVEMDKRKPKNADNSVSSSSSVFKTPVEFNLTPQVRDAGLSFENDVEYIYPCPPGQDEFLERGSKASKMWVLMTIRPMEHDWKLWAATVQKLTETEDILRTTYLRSETHTQNADAEPIARWVGVVLKTSSPRAAVKLDVIDVQDDESRSQAVNSIWEQKFVFGEPFIRFAILKYPNGKQEVLTKMDHGLYDGTLLRVWASHFSAIQRSAPIPEYTPFRDFATHLWNSDKASALQYWSSEIRRSPSTFPSLGKTDFELCADTVVSVPVSMEEISTIDEAASKANVTVPIVFQAAFQLWLSQATARNDASNSTGYTDDISFDYLNTGRNVDLPNPQEINGTCATFFPLRSKINHNVDAKGYLEETQNKFWEATENANVGPDEIYAAAGLPRSSYQNQVLFLFQPFTPPAVAPEEKDLMRFVQMAGSQIRMPQPYALVAEIKKIPSGYKVQFTFDTRVMSVSDAEEGVRGVKRTLRLLLDVLKKEGKLEDVVV